MPHEFESSDHSGTPPDSTRISGQVPELRIPHPGGQTSLPDSTAPELHRPVRILRAANPIKPEAAGTPEKVPAASVPPIPLSETVQLDATGSKAAPEDNGNIPLSPQQAAEAFEATKSAVTTPQQAERVSRIKEHMRPFYDDHDYVPFLAAPFHVEGVHAGQPVDDEVSYSMADLQLHDLSGTLSGIVVGAETTASVAKELHDNTGHVVVDTIPLNGPNDRIHRLGGHEVRVGYHGLEAIPIPNDGPLRQTVMTPYQKSDRELHLVNTADRQRIVFMNNPETEAVTARLNITHTPEPEDIAYLGQVSAALSRHAELLLEAARATGVDTAVYADTDALPDYRGSFDIGNPACVADAIVSQAVRDGTLPHELREKVAGSITDISKLLHALDNKTPEAPPQPYARLQAVVNRIHTYTAVATEQLPADPNDDRPDFD
jgi:hypothetical protein